MTFRGIVRNGKVELESGSELPDGVSVDVSVSVPAAKRSRKRSGQYDAAFHLADLAVPSGRTDGSVEHDHYIYGTPKRSPKNASSRRTKKSKSTRARR